jgi:hypothetical protein
MHLMAVGGVHIDDPDALSKLAQLEGDRWLADDRRTWTLYRSATTAHAFLHAWNVGHAPEVPEADRQYWREISDLPLSCIYGDGGYARFPVADDGEIVLDAGSTRPEKIARAEALGFRVPR